jgi:hypothetical protein
MTRPEQLSDFIDELSRECPGAIVNVDAPRDPKGEWWLDVTSGDFQTNVSWRPKFGFGFFTSDDKGFGDRPDEIYRRPTDACTRLCQLIGQRRANEAVDPMRLKDVRHMVGTPQTKLAAALKTNQAAVSRMENRKDMYLSSLGEYIHAMGGELELRAKFKDFEVRIDPLLVAKQKAGR